MPRFKAVAVSYDSRWPAPLLLCKAQGDAARRLEQMAKEFHIPVERQDKLVDALSLLPEGSFVPEDYFEAMAILLSAVYRLRDLSKSEKNHGN